ncbi:unnamed protein product [Caenorhabditis nigoni]
MSDNGVIKYERPGDGGCCGNRDKKNVVNADRAPENPRDNGMSFQPRRDIPTTPGDGPANVNVIKRPGDHR